MARRQWRLRETRSDTALSMTITLPGGEDGATRTEQLRYSGFRTNAYTFSLGGASFELRESGTKKPLVRRLVKLPASSPQSAEASESKSTGSLSEERCKQATNQLRFGTLTTSMGEPEVIAIWTEGTVPNKHGRLAVFQFVSLAKAEELGGIWDPTRNQFCSCSLSTWRCD